MGQPLLGSSKRSLLRTTVASREIYQSIRTVTIRGLGEGTVTARVNTPACGGLEGRTLQLSLPFVGHSHVPDQPRPQREQGVVRPQVQCVSYRSPNFCLGLAWMNRSKNCMQNVVLSSNAQKSKLEIAVYFLG